MGDFVEVAVIGELRDGSVKGVSAGGRRLLVARVGDSYYAVDDVCPHMGARLSEGKLENLRGVAKKITFMKGDISAAKNLSACVDRMLGCRYELKYVVSESKAQAITRFVEPHLPLDRYCKEERNGVYPIVTLYLDSHNLQLCRESLEGHKNRFKLRIRSYTDDPEYPRFFEIKRRMNTIIIKDRARVKHPDIANILSESSILCNHNSTDAEILKQFNLYVASINAKPVMKVRYLRRAYEGDSNNRVRITFDRQLAFNASSVPEVLFGGHGWQRYPIRGVILEIKFTGRYPVWLNRMIKCFNLHQQSFSKYARSVKKACSLKFCAPLIPIREY